MPWWGAVLVAVVTTAVGITLDSGDKELGGVFGSLYALGCVLAVLAVRHSGIFTAIIQPPMILFVTVPGAYFLFHGAKFTDLKDTLINCAYPLVERFPLMLFTAAGVLLIGMTRWYFASVVKPHPSESAADSDSSAAVGFAGIASGFTSALKSAFGSKVHDDASDQTPEERPRRQRATHSRSAEGRPRPDRSASDRATSDRATSDRATSDRGRRTSTRSRHARPPVDEGQPPRRARRPRDEQSHSRTSRREPSSRDDYGRPSGRVRRPDTDEPRGYEPRDPYPTYSPRERYQPYEPPPRRRPESGDSRSGSEYPRDPQGGTAGRHPLSRVRYRGERDGEPRGSQVDRDNWR